MHEGVEQDCRLHAEPSDGAAGEDLGEECDCFHVGWFCWLVLVGLGLYDLGQVIHQEVDSEFVAFAFGVSKFVQHDFIAILNDYLPLAFATHYHTWI